jgi:hypothetical protein
LELWYPAHAIFDLHKSPFFDPDVYFPYGFSLIRNHDLSPATVLLFMPLTRLIGEIGTYNVFMPGSFVLTVFGTYLLGPGDVGESRRGRHDGTRFSRPQSLRYLIQFPSRFDVASQKIGLGPCDSGFAEMVLFQLRL